MNYDPGKITALLSELKSAIALLKDIAEMDPGQFLADPHRIASAKYNFIVAIEAIIDICNHLISKNGFRVPEDYADAIRIMAENNVFTADYADTLIKMIKFRNRLVHVYWKVDSAKLSDILKANLNDFCLFTKALNGLLQ